MRKERRKLKKQFENETCPLLKSEKLQLYIKKQKEIRERMKEERKTKIERKFNKMIEEENNQGFWNEIKKRKRDETATWICIKDEMGKRLLDPEKIKNKVAVYYESLYKKILQTEPNMYHDQVQEAITQFGMDKQYDDKAYNRVPTKKEIEKSIAKKKNKKTTTDFPNELIKQGGTKMVNLVHNLISYFWETEIAPCPWNEGIITNVWKGKGDRERMEFQRGITVSSTIGMIAEDIINYRMTNSEILLSLHSLREEVKKDPLHEIMSLSSMGCCHMLLK
jgi:hypothetical protein